MVTFLQENDDPLAKRPWSLIRCKLPASKRFSRFRMIGIDPGAEVVVKSNVPDNDVGALLVLVEFVVFQHEGSIRWSHESPRGAAG